MKREVERELLDELPAGDRRAIGARRDLQKINAWMGHAHVMVRALAGAFTDRSPRSIVELGAGDGTLLLRLAKRIAPRWKPLRVVLVDRQRLLSPRTKAEFEALSWHVESLEMDVFDWLQRPDPEHSDVTIASLFLHHFTEVDLRRLLWHAAHQTAFFLACEPQRVNFTLCAAALLRFIGCNDLTRHDAKISVRAGFAENELSALWPVDGGWRLMEQQVGLFSHCFVAQRISKRRSCDDSDL
jgi:methyltransferase family protein